jgi:hypothetical protein
VTDRCWACDGNSLTPIFSIEGIPLSSLILMDTRDEAVGFPRGDLDLVVCESCGFIFNRLFRPEAVDYTMPYEENQAFSPRFQEFEQELVDHLITDYDLAGREIFEIGCGKASFLERLCRDAGARGLGIDPAFVPGRIGGDVDVTGLREFFDEDHTHLTGDLICCRHTLEHIQPVGHFMSLVRRSAINRPGSVVFFEIPDTERILDEGAFWDVYNEHCSYFTVTSLSNLFRSRGFEILLLHRGFDDQYLLIDAVVGEVDESVDEVAVRATVEKAVGFGAATAEAVASWRELVTSAASSGRDVVLWGASSKAVGFLSALDRDDAISAAVDINPFKQDKFLPRSGHPVVAPEALRHSRPDLVIVMNPIYVPEITDMLNGFGLDAEVRALGVAAEPVGDGRTP